MKIQFQGGAVAEVSDAYGESLLSTGQWELVEASTPKPRRPRRSAPAPVVDATVSGGALASEE